MNELNREKNKMEVKNSEVCFSFLLARVNRITDCTKYLKSGGEQEAHER